MREWRRFSTTGGNPPRTRGSRWRIKFGIFAARGSLSTSAETVPNCEYLFTQRTYPVFLSETSRLGYWLKTPPRAEKNHPVCTNLVALRAAGLRPDCAKRGRPNPVSTSTNESNSMNEDEIRAALDRHWAASDANDFDVEHDIYREEAVLEYPQSGERITGRHNIQASRVAQPSSKRFTVRRIVGTGDLRVHRVHPRVRRPAVVHREHHGAPGWQGGPRDPILCRPV